MVRGSLSFALIVACTSSSPDQASEGSTASATTGGPGGDPGGGPGPTSGTMPTTGTNATTGADPTTAGDPTGEPRPDAGSSSGGEGLGPADFAEGELDAPSNGGTITFQQIGAPGWYPSRRDPEVGPCDAYEADGCCLAQQEVTGDLLTPWDEDLIMTLRGPLQVKQFAAYQPAAGDASRWELVSGWDERTPAAGLGIAFKGNGSESGFSGAVGTECLINVSTDQPFACGAGSSPFCPGSMTSEYHGWAGSKLFVLLATMPRADSGAAGEPCSEDMSGNWYDAPWVGLSLGELVRAGAFSSCQCYAKNPDEWYLGDGCGQFNVFEVVNDNNDYQNFEVFSTNFFGYAGYVGEGPCGDQCDVSQLGPEVDLIDKGENVEAATGGVATPMGGPGVAFRRPTEGYRYFLILLDTTSRTVQLAVVHPLAVPEELSPLLPNLPASVPQATISEALELRLPM